MLASMATTVAAMNGHRTHTFKSGKTETQKTVDRMAAGARIPALDDAKTLRAILPDEVADALLAAQGGAIEKDQRLIDAGAMDQPLISMQARHDAIIRLRAQGMHPIRIASAVGVTRRTVENVVKNWYEKHAKELKELDLDEFVLMLADGYLEDIDRLTDIIAAWSGQRAPMGLAVMSAIKIRQETRQKYIDLLAEFGFLKRKALEVDVTVQGGGDTYNQMIFLRPEDIRAASMEFLAMKREARGEPRDALTDESISDLIVASDSPEHPAAG